MPEQSTKDIDEYIQKFEKYQNELNDIGFILTGSIITNYTRCYSAGCRCMDDSEYRHGPYYNWTRKIRGKTVTVRLTKEEAETLKKWTENKKLFYEIIKKMEKITLDAVEEIRS